MSFYGCKKLSNLFLKLEHLRVFLRVCCAIFSFTTDLSAADAASRPNVIVILADDLGRADYSAYGTPDIETPHIDSLFREGMTWNNFYANSSVCSPTRAALLTGCYPDRVGVPGVIRDVPEDSWGYLSHKAVLLPSLLNKLGYETAIIGKWHLGYEEPNTPLDRGFHFFHGFLGDMMDDYWTHLRHGHNFMRLNREVIEPQGHATDLFSDWACEYLKTRTVEDKPFFLYLAYNAPHDPIQPPPEWLKKIQTRSPQLSDKRSRLVALIEHMDDGIGRVLKTLEGGGLANKTLVIFTSDNGGPLNTEANNTPWKSGKGHMYEGGLRVPCAMRWPEGIPPSGSTEAIAVSMDLFPTILELAGGTPEKGIDGISLVPVIRTPTTSLPERILYFCRREGGLNYGGKTIDAIRIGPWKLVQDSPFLPCQLYNLETDPQESKNLIGKEKTVRQELSKAIRLQIQKGGAVPWQPPR